MEKHIQQILQEYRKQLCLPKENWPHEIQRMLLLLNENFFSATFLQHVRFKKSKN